MSIKLIFLTESIIAPSNKYPEKEKRPDSNVKHLQFSFNFNNIIEPSEHDVCRLNTSHLGEGNMQKTSLQQISHKRYSASDNV